MTPSEARIRPVDPPAQEWLDRSYTCSFRKGTSGIGTVTLHGGKLVMPYHLVASPSSARLVAMRAIDEFERGTTPMEGVFRKLEKAMKLGPAPSPNRRKYPYVGTLVFQGIPICVETAKGQTRSGKGWSVVMPHHYGEVPGTEGLDGDPVDVCIGDDATAPCVYVVHQANPETGEYDEDKALLGYSSLEQAVADYLTSHSNDPRVMGGVTVFMLDQFRDKLADRGASLCDPWLTGMADDQAVALVKATKIVHVREHQRINPRTGQSETVREHDETRTVADASPPPLRQAMGTEDAVYNSARIAQEEQLAALDEGHGLEKAIGARVVHGDRGEKPTEHDFAANAPLLIIAALKSQDRASKKVHDPASGYHGDWGRLVDLVRSTVAVNSYADVAPMLEKIRGMGLEIVRHKDRFKKPTDTDYRDILLNVRWPNGHIGELQVHVKSMLRAKQLHGGHGLYEEEEAIRRHAEAEHRDMTEEEEALYDKARDAQRALYGAAWASQLLRKARMLPRAPVTATFEEESETMENAKAIEYYSYGADDIPAFRRPRWFPVKVVNGKNVDVADLEDFHREATRITKAEFDALCARSRRA